VPSDPVLLAIEPVDAVDPGRHALLTQQDEQPTVAERRLRRPVTCMGFRHGEPAHAGGFLFGPSPKVAEMRALRRSERFEGSSQSIQLYCRTSK
jgi:hypothetical protein